MRLGHKWSAQRRQDGSQVHERRRRAADGSWINIYANNNGITTFNEQIWDFYGFEIWVNLMLTPAAAEEPATGRVRCKSTYAARSISARR